VTNHLVFLNFNFHKEQCMLSDVHLMIETRRSVSSVNVNVSEF